MKAIVYESWGPPSSLQLREIPSPVPGPKQVPVRASAAAVSFADPSMVSGKYRPEQEFLVLPSGKFSVDVIALDSD